MKPCIVVFQKEEAWDEKKGTVINHHWCSASSLLGPAFCHHKFNSSPTSSSFPLYSIFTWKLIFFSSPPSPSCGPCIPKLLSFLTSLCFSHPLPQQSSPEALLPYLRSSGEQSLHFFSSFSLCPRLPWSSLHPKYILPLPSLLYSRKGDRFMGRVWEISKVFVSLWELPGEKRWLQEGESFGAPEQPLQLGVIPEDLSQKTPEFWWV